VALQYFTLVVVVVEKMERAQLALVAAHLLRLKKAALGTVS
jgi:hypothetical protein